MITSKDNPQLKELKKLQEKRFRSRRGKFAAEGEDLVEAALEAGWKPSALYFAPDAADEFGKVENSWEVDYDVLASACALGSGSRVVAVFDLPEPIEPKLGRVTLSAVAVGDPGNVGTMIRSAAAFSDSPVLLSACADPYSPKALRAAMGSTFTNPPVEGSKSVNVDLGVTTVALDADGDVLIADVPRDRPIVLTVGAERLGLDEDFLDAADYRARIPMLASGPESLNVAMAATIALYELSKGINETPPK